MEKNYQDIAFQDNKGNSNLIYASRSGHKTVVELLLKKYSDVDMVGKGRKTALYWAIEKGHSTVVKVCKTLLLENIFSL